MEKIAITMRQSDPIVQRGAVVKAFQQARPTSPKPKSLELMAGGSFIVKEEHRRGWIIGKVRSVSLNEITVDSITIDFIKAICQH